MELNITQMYHPTSQSNGSEGVLYDDGLMGDLDYSDMMTYLADRGMLTHKDYLPAPFSDHLTMMFVIMYVSIIALSVVGNVIVIAVVSRSSTLRTVTNAFLVSLAISDLLIAVVNMPLQLIFLLRNEWDMGSVACKMTNYVQGVTIVVSILTLTGMAIDR